MSNKGMVKLFESRIVIKKYGDLHNDYFGNSEKDFMKTSTIVQV